MFQCHFTDTQLRCYSVNGSSLTRSTARIRMVAQTNPITLFTLKYLNVEVSANALNASVCFIFF